MKNELGKNIKSFDCDSVINGKRFLLIVASVITFIYIIFQFDFNNIANIKFIIGLVVFVLLMFCTVSGFITQKKCFVSVNENGIYGLRPAFPGRAKYFTVYYKDIVKIQDLIMPVNKIPPVAYIRTNNKNLLITCLNKDDLDFLVKYCKTKARDNNEMS